jgi:ligand-binding SRPBCC domain-containing protein
MICEPINSLLNGAPLIIMCIRTKFNHRFKVKAPLSEVAEFHQKSASMVAVTPPPIRVQMHQSPETLTNGSEMAFTLRLGPLPVRWQARIENLSGSGFTDRQLKGPFMEWVHEHTFVWVDDDTTEVRDQISIQLRPHLVWWLVGLCLYSGLPVLFKYRAWKTRRLLERGSR